MYIIIYKKMSGVIVLGKKSYIKETEGINGKNGIDQTHKPGLKRGGYSRPFGT